MCNIRNIISVSTVLQSSHEIFVERKTHEFQRDHNHQYIRTIGENGHYGNRVKIVYRETIATVSDTPLPYTGMNETN